MQSKALLAAVLVASAFAGVGFASVGAASVAGSSLDAAASAQGDVAPAQDDRITGDNVTVSNLNVTNVTFRNVYVNRLVANATHDGTDETVELRNVSVAEVRVGNGSLQNATFDTIGLDRQFSTDLLGDVGTGTDPEDTLPPEPMEGRNLSDRTIVGVEFGQLDVSGASLQNVTVESGSVDAPIDVSNATVTGQGVSVEDASASDVTVAGWSGNETDG